MSKYSSFFLLSSAEYEKLTDKLRVRKYGSWLAEEAWIREDQSQKRALFTLKAIDLAKKIAKEKDITDEEAFELLQSTQLDGNDIMEGFSMEAAGLMASMPSAREQQERLVTAFMKNRGEVLVGKKWEPTDEWTEDDTKKLPQALLQQIEAFMDEEEGEKKQTEDEEDSEKN
jgi:hypothetical protein